MKFKLTHRKVDGVAIVDLGGHLILGQETGALRTTIEELLAAGEKKVLLNLAGVGYIDSCGLSLLVGGFLSATSAKGQMKLVNLDRRVHDVIRVTRLHTVFEVFNDEREAIHSFAAAPSQAAAAPGRFTADSVAS